MCIENPLLETIKAKGGIKMTVQLTQKEQTLLQDLQKHEETCIKKYQENAAKAQDPALKQLFLQLATQEQKHYQTLTQILSGQTPNMNQQTQQGQQQSGNQQQMGLQQNFTGGQVNLGNEQDAFLCNDLLMAEKYVSGTYDTAIFEFRDSNIRQALNHIQKEEQQHGEEIYKYMASHGLYNLQ